MSRAAHDYDPFEGFDPLEPDLSPRLPDAPGGPRSVNEVLARVEHHRPFVTAKEHGIISWTRGLLLGGCVAITIGAIVLSPSLSGDASRSSLSPAGLVTPVSQAVFGVNDRVADEIRSAQVPAARADDSIAKRAEAARRSARRAALQNGAMGSSPDGASGDGTAAWLIDQTTISPQLNDPDPR